MKFWIFNTSSASKFGMLAAAVVCISAVPESLLAQTQAQWTLGTGGVAYYTGGNVGIGTSNPGLNALQIGAPNYPSNGYALYANGGQYGAEISINNTSGLGLQVGNAANGTSGLALDVVNNVSSGLVDLFNVGWNGNVGIGTLTPTALLNVGNAGVPFGNVTTLGIAVRPTDTVGLSVRTGSSNTAYPNPTIQFCTTGHCNYIGMSNASGSLLLGNFGTTGYIGNTDAAAALVIAPSGNVGIGTTNPCTNSQAPSNCKMSVAGAIQAQAVVVNTGWSDYVFAPGYHLQPLSEVAAYVKENQHLPGIPSAAEVEKSGVNVGEMESKLLAKVEELTLHMIEAEKRNDRLEQQNQALQQQNQALEQRLGRLETQAGAPDKK